jgi:hypothetical protein
MERSHGDVRRDGEAEAMRKLRIKEGGWRKKVEG